jgi:drug/metabolite transporter (DMT)-like permease
VPIESLALVAALSSAIAHLAAKQAVGAAAPAAFLAVRWSSAALVMTTILLLGPGWGSFRPGLPLLALATGAVLGPVVGWLLYLRALPRLDVSVAQPIFNSSSVVTMALAVAFLGEQPNAFTVLGAALILAGVHILQGVAPRRPAPGRRAHRRWQPAILLVLGGAACLGVAGFFFRLGLGVLSPAEANWVRTTMPALVLVGGNLLVETRLAARAAATRAPGEPKRVFLTWRGLGLGVVAALTNDVAGWLLRLTAMKDGLLIVVEPLAATSPLFVALLSAALLGERLGRRGWLGVSATVAGAVLLAGWGR